jgi:LysR family transcriptional regulator, regulator for bpeEF and oprC
MITLDSVTALVVAVKEGSFSAAARELGCTPSAVSKKIALLENKLGVALFNRTTRKLALTEAGREFYSRCTRGLAEIESAETFVKNFRKTPQGSLRVRVPQAFGRLKIAPFIPEFMLRYPEIKVDLIFAPTEHDPMDVDILIGSSAPPNANLIVRPLTTLERITCAAPSYLERAGQPAKFKDLERHNCLTFSGSDSIENEWNLYRGDAVERVRVSGTFRTNDAEALFKAAVAGVGVVHMPSFIILPALQSGELVGLFSDERGRHGAVVSAYYTSSKHRLPKVKVLIDFLAQLFK